MITEKQKAIAAANSLLEAAGINSLPVDLHRIAKTTKTIKLLSYDQAEKQLILPEEVIDQLKAIAYATIVDRVVRGRKSYFVLYNDTKAPLIRIGVRCKTAEEIGRILLGDKGDLDTFVRHLLCPPAIVKPLYGKDNLFNICAKCAAPKDMVFQALL